MDSWVRSQNILNTLIKGDHENTPNLNKLDDSPWGIEENDKIASLIHSSHVYEINQSLSKMFSVTANEVRAIQLPFEDIFFDTKIKFKKCTIYGILLTGQVTKTRTDSKGEDYYGYQIEICTVWERQESDGMTYGVSVIPFYHSKPEKDMKDNKEFKGDICGLLRRFIMNFNDFLEHRDIKIKDRIRTNQKQRERRGKMPLPSSKKIYVRGELFVYLNSIASKNGESEDMSGCYEVAGHWRRFRHPRYTKMRGKKTFIHPFIRGTGVPTVKNRKLSGVKS